MSTTRSRTRSTTSRTSNTALDSPQHISAQPCSMKKTKTEERKNAPARPMTVRQRRTKNHKERRRDARERTRGTHNTKSQVASSTHLRRWIASVTGTTGSRNDSRISFICSRRCERCPNTSRADDSSPSDDLAIVAYPHSNLHAL